MKKDILDHVAICTDDIKKSVIWYTENFNVVFCIKIVLGQCLNLKMLN